MKSNKTSKIEFKLEEDLFIQYKSFCEKQGLDMSKRLRLFINQELKYGELGINIIDKLNSV